MIEIRTETTADFRSVEELTRDAFWNVYRPGCFEHFVLRQFRSSSRFVPELSLVMEEDGKLIGHVMYARSAVELTGGGTLPVMTFGPISICPSRQRQGLGKRLLDESMVKAAALGAGALLIAGNIAFYGKSGFIPASNFGIRYADADPSDALVPYFLAKELVPGFLSKHNGLYRDPPEYFIAQRDPTAFEAYEASFPAREKKRLPQQIFNA